MLTLSALAGEHPDHSGDQSAKDQIQNPYKDTHDQYRGNDNKHIIDGLLLGRPYDLTRFRPQLAKPLVCTRKDRGLLGFAVLLFICHEAVSFPFFGLLGLAMDSMLSAETAVLVHLQTIGIVLLVLHRVVISLLALRAGERYSNAHSGTSSINLRPQGVFGAAALSGPETSRC